MFFRFVMLPFLVIKVLESTKDKLMVDEFLLKVIKNQRL